MALVHCLECMGCHVSFFHVVVLALLPLDCATLVVAVLAVLFFHESFLHCVLSTKKGTVYVNKTAVKKISISLHNQSF